MESKDQEQFQAPHRHQKRQVIYLEPNHGSVDTAGDTARPRDESVVPLTPGEQQVVDNRHYVPGTHAQITHPRPPYAPHVLLPAHGARQDSQASIMQFKPVWPDPQFRKRGFEGRKYVYPIEGAIQLEPERRSDFQSTTTARANPVGVPRPHDSASAGAQHVAPASSIPPTFRGQFPQPPAPSDFEPAGQSYIFPRRSPPIAPYDESHSSRHLHAAHRSGTMTTSSVGQQTAASSRGHRITGESARSQPVLAVPRVGHGSHSGGTVRVPPIHVQATVPPPPSALTAASHAPVQVAAAASPGFQARIHSPVSAPPIPAVLTGAPFQSRLTVPRPAPAPPAMTSGLAPPPAAPGSTLLHGGLPYIQCLSCPARFQEKSGKEAIEHVFKDHLKPAYGQLLLLAQTHLRRSHTSASSSSTEQTHSDGHYCTVTECHARFPLDRKWDAIQHVIFHHLKKDHSVLIRQARAHLSLFGSNDRATAPQ